MLGLTADDLFGQRIAFDLTCGHLDPSSSNNHRGTEAQRSFTEKGRSWREPQKTLNLPFTSSVSLCLCGSKRIPAPTIRDVAAMEFQLQVSVEIDPERLEFRFTHRVRHDRAPNIATKY